MPWIDPVLQIDVHGKAKSSERCKYIQRLVFSQQGMGGGVHRVELAIRTVRFVDILSHVILNYRKSEPGDAWFHKRKCQRERSFEFDAVRQALISVLHRV